MITFNVSHLLNFIAPLPQIHSLCCGNCCVCLCACGHTVCYPPRLLQRAAMSQIGPLMLILCLWETRVRPHRTQRACYTVTHNKRQAVQRGELRDGHTHCVTAAARGSSGGLELPQRRSQRFSFCSSSAVVCVSLARSCT